MCCEARRQQPCSLHLHSRSFVLIHSNPTKANEKHQRFVIYISAVMAQVFPLKRQLIRDSVERSSAGGGRRGGGGVKIKKYY